MKPQSVAGFALLVGRFLLAPVFIYDAILLLRFPADSAAYMTRFGVPDAFLYPTALFEFCGGVMIVAGLALRPAALAFAGFCLLTAILFHADPGNPAECIQFGKDIGLTGGFVCLFLQGAGTLSIDHFLHHARPIQSPET